jgi:hypothetical protein
MTNKFKVGDKVVPISKSAGCTFKHSQFKRHGLKFLYVKSDNDKDCDYLCYKTTQNGDGDFYMEKDLVLYKEEFKKGDKVVPISKSTGDSWKASVVINDYLASKAKYIYVVDPAYQTVDGQTVISCDNKNSTVGDFFLAKDLIPYVEKSNKKENNMNKNTKSKIQVGDKVIGANSCLPVKGEVVLIDGYHIVVKLDVKQYIQGIPFHTNYVDFFENELVKVTEPKILKTVQFVYSTPGKAIKWRTVDVTVDNTEYLEGIDKEIGEFRRFRKDRILGEKIINC